MKLQFPSHDLALGFADGLADPDGLDVYATVEGCILELLGVDDSSIIESAIELGAIEIKERQ
jgi:hypothetical protein